jgi:hypothetical protein
MSEGAAGPWLVVVGMHRSGTSAVTGAVGALGFNAVSADDRLSPHESNAEHWESLSILRHNDDILAHFGGTWDAPPALPEGWETERGLPDRSIASSLLAEAYPSRGPSVWKDPRACLLLPYWREVLQGPVTAVFVWRAPLAVARSLHRRNGIPVPYGVALWERYNRSAIANLAETDVYVIDYDAVIENAESVMEGIISWLRSTRGLEGLQRWDEERALSVITSDLRHESMRATDRGDHILLDEQSQLVRYLTELGGAHHGLPPLPNDESPWTEAMLEARRSSSILELRKLQRQVEHTEGERDWFASALEVSYSNLASLKATWSWRITAPLRSVAARRANASNRLFKSASDNGLWTRVQRTILGAVEATRGPSRRSE